MPITKDELKKMILTEPSIKRKRAAKEIAASGSYWAKQELEIQKRRRHSMRGEGRKWQREVIVLPWIHQARSKGKTMGAHFNNRATGRTTVVFSFKLRDPSLWIFPHTLTFYVRAFAAGNLSDGEMQEILDWLNHCQ